MLGIVFMLSNQPLWQATSDCQYITIQVGRKDALPEIRHFSIIIVHEISFKMMPNMPGCDR